MLWFVDCVSMLEDYAVEKLAVVKTKGQARYHLLAAFYCSVCRWTQGSKKRLPGYHLLKLGRRLELVEMPNRLHPSLGGAFGPFLDKPSESHPGLRRLRHQVFFARPCRVL